jgi:hypothetical protein
MLNPYLAKDSAKALPIPKFMALYLPYDDPVINTQVPFPYLS